MVTAAPSFSSCIAGVYKCNTASVSETKSAKMYQKPSHILFPFWYIDKLEVN